MYFRYVANINQRWFKRIMMMVPKKLLKNQQEIKKIHEEIKDDYLFAVKKSIVDQFKKVLSLTFSTLPTQL